MKYCLNNYGYLHYLYLVFLLLTHMSASGAIVAFTWLYAVSMVVTLVGYFLQKSFSRYIIMGGTGVQIFLIVVILISLWIDSWCEGWTYYQEGAALIDAAEDA